MSELKKCPMPGCEGEGRQWTDANGVDLVNCTNEGGDVVPACELWFESDALHYKVWQALPRQNDAVAELVTELSNILEHVSPHVTKIANWRLRDWKNRLAAQAGQPKQEGVLLVRMSCPDCGTALVPREDAFACPNCDTYCGGPDGKAPRVSPVYGTLTTDVVLCETDACAWVGAIDAIAEALGIKEYAYATEVMEAVRSVVRARDRWKIAEHETRHGIADCTRCPHLSNGDALVDPVAKERTLLQAVRDSICPDCDTEGWTKHDDGKVSSCITCHGVGYGRTRMRAALDNLEAWKREHKC